MVSHPLIWKKIVENSTKMEDLRRIIKQQAVADTASRQGLEISTFYLTDDMLKDIVRMDLAPGGGLPVFSNLQCGMCILHTLPTSAGQVSEFQQIEESYRKTKNTRTFADTKEGTRIIHESQQIPTTRSGRMSQCTQCISLHCLERNVHTTKGCGHSAAS